MGKKEVKRAWQNFLDVLIADDINWGDYYDTKTETSVSKALQVIHNAFKESGIYE